jgi:hypothetical protein
MCGSTSGKRLPAAKRMTSKMRTRRKRMALRAANVEPCVLEGGRSGMSWGEMKRVMGVFMVMSYVSWENDNTYINSWCDCSYYNVFQRHNNLQDLFLCKRDFRANKIQFVTKYPLIESSFILS